MCDTVVTRLGGPDAGWLLAKNSDRDPTEPQALRHYPAARHDHDATVRCTWREVEQVERTHAVTVSQPWWMWGAEMGANEHGVTIGNEAVFTRRTAREPARGLLGMDLLRLALERGRDRREAVHTIVSLLERHGQDGPCSHAHPSFSYDNSFLVVDPQGATLVETAGRAWATREVEGSAAISNGLTIPGFADRYADPLRGAVAQCRRRRGITASAAEAAVGPASLMAALRTHEGGGGPRYRSVNGALGAPCAHAGGLLTSTQTTGSWVADLRPSAPAGGRHWVTGTSAPCTSIFKPIRVSPADVAAVGDPVAMPGQRVDPAYLWWRHERLHALAVRDWPLAQGVMVPERDAIEASWAADPPDAATAFAEAEAIEARWTERLGDRDLVDRRPATVRLLWSRWRQQSGAAA